jgi:polyhydroxybutyrate depolymerase
MISSRNACLAAARSFAVASVLLWLPSCGSSGGGTTTGTGGDTGSGGSSSSGGTTGTGGVKGSGGSSNTGGTTGTGGVNGTGGTTGTGGTVGTGGTGGSAAAGGTTGTGGTIATGGSSGTGGVKGTGGATATGGATGTGGTGTGGSPGTGGSATGGSSGTCPTTVLKTGDSNESITSGGESRTFIVHVPTDYTGSSPVPVVLDFHPLGGTGSSQEGSSGWKAKCDSVGCIAVFPDSSKTAGDNSWNAGYCCDNAEAKKIDDVQFARDIIKWLEANACVDPKRIYASGGSNGGGMTYRMACEAADVIAAVAPVDFRCVTGKDPLASTVTASNNTACTCILPRPIAVIGWDEGADTSVVPYGGGQTPNLKTDCAPNSSCVGIGFSSAVVNSDTWAKFDMCTGSATADANNSLCQTYTSCSANTQVTLCTTTSGGHLAVYGNSSAKFADTSWNVLKTQTLP